MKRWISTRLLLIVSVFPRSKTELDDLSHKYLQPEVYKELSEKLALRKDTREAFIHKIMDEVKKHMDDAGIEAKVDRPCETFLQHL